MNSQVVSKMFRRYQDGMSLEAIAQLYGVTDHTVRNHFLKDNRYRQSYISMQQGADRRINQKSVPTRADWCLLYLFVEEGQKIGKFGICNWYRLNARRRELHSHSGFENLRLVKAVRATAQAEKDLKTLLNQEPETIGGTVRINKVLSFMDQFEEYREIGEIYTPVQSRY